MTGAAWPFFAVLAILAFPVMRLLYGPQWDASIPLARILCVSGAMGAPFWLIGSIIQALGKPKYSLLLESAGLPVKAVLIILAAPWGIEAVAASFVLTNCYAVTANFLVLRKLIGLRVSELFAALTRSAAVAALAGVGPALLWWLVPVDGWRHWIILATSLPAGAAGWLLGLFLFKHPLWGELISGMKRLRSHVRWR